ncbi:ALI_collapsed_G0033300.mRNA.1.CDS.1 [Saccharomyces cerevisiae]|nr:ALI_collapsed_G0033300.mRNA.1.CDS.1 [Saccharomyces cerevisiae]
METTITSCSGGICTTLMSPVTSFNSKATTSNNAESTIPKAIKVSCSAGACTTLTTVDAGISMFTRTGLSITQTTVTNCSGGTCTMLTAPIATATSKVISQIPKASSATSIAHSSASYTVNINTNGAYNFDKDNIFGTAIVAVVALLLL